MLRILFTWVLAFIGVVVAMWVLGSYTGPMKKWLAMLIAIVCLSPYLLWKIIFPPAFDLTCFAKTVDYEFRDPVYALEFERLNCGLTPQPPSP